MYILANHKMAPVTVKDDEALRPKPIKCGGDQVRKFSLFQRKRVSIYILVPEKSEISLSLRDVPSVKSCLLTRDTRL